MQLTWAMHLTIFQVIKPSPHAFEKWLFPTTLNYLNSKQLHNTKGFKNVLIFIPAIHSILYRNLHIISETGISHSWPFSIWTDFSHSRRPKDERRVGFTIWPIFLLGAGSEDKVSTILLQTMWKPVKSQEFGDLDKRAVCSEKLNSVSLQDSAGCSVLSCHAHTEENS